MRIHAHVGHPDYSPLAIWIAVYVDGKPLVNCIEADDEAGTATVYRTRGNGTVVMADSEHVAIRHLRGAVSIVPAPGAPAWMTDRPLAELLVVHRAPVAAVPN